MVDELHDRLRQRGWPPLPHTFGFVLLAVSQGPATVVSIAGLLGVSKQAASKVVTAMTEAGFVERRPHDGDGRAKSIVLTDRGAELLATVEEVYAEIEAEWGEVVGPDRVEAMRDDLLDVVRATHEGQVPEVRPPS
jgi:DNA-binding MarR family transcriptional regulator